MTLAVSQDMGTFLLMLLILVAGNIFTMQLIYPSVLQADLNLTESDRNSIADHFDGWGHAIFGSLDMLFSSNFDKELLDKAYSPILAYCYYCWFVVLVPLTPDLDDEADGFRYLDAARRRRVDLILAELLRPEAGIRLGPVAVARGDRPTRVEQVLRAIESLS